MNQKYNISDINWDELAEIGIVREEMSDETVNRLLQGEKTEVMSLSLCILGVDIVMDATLQLVEASESPVLEIEGIKPQTDTSA